ncbi:GAF domain-containing SpoIIE family protein phosphatase [Streptomyces sp. NPDC047023]|uniref:PP2C family protein-serine/threonine phosphatase n=1 Tax=Streptomyces sp. NPDC047023 TaxID=3155139 RepID=UPI0033D659E2
MARLTANTLGTPMAAVVILDEDRILLPGLSGIALADRSLALPLAHSACLVHASAPRYATGTADRAHWLAVLGHANSYASMPITDEAGHHLGVLYAADRVRRAWTSVETQNLTDLAAAVGRGLSLRIAHRRALERARTGAGARQEAHHAQRKVRAALAWSAALVRTTQELSQATGLWGIRRIVRRLAVQELGAAYVALLTVDGGRLRHIAHPDDDNMPPLASYSLQEPWPTSRAVRERSLVTVTSREQLAAEYGPQARRTAAALGLRSGAFFPLTSGSEVIGVLAIGWRDHKVLDAGGQRTVRILAAGAGQAAAQASFYESRARVARRMQRALLSDLPAVTGLDIQVRYMASGTHDVVGGDWYDVYTLPAQENLPLGGPSRRFALTIGDVTGHDTQATIIMGQLRSMLRQACLDHHLDPPAAAVAAVESAVSHLAIPAGATLFHAHLEQDLQGWNLSWTNAGHPAALLLDEQGRITRLEDGSVMLHSDLPAQPRHSHRRSLGPGSILLMYSDGLVETRDGDIDAAIEDLSETLSSASHRPLAEVLEALSQHLTRTVGDDVVLLAVRLLGADA